MNMEQPLSLKLASLSLISQCKLKNILALCGDKKDLIIDPSLIKPLERICGVSWLRYDLGPLFYLFLFVAE
jgi:vacuolar protein sorting-associated protein 33B